MLSPSATGNLNIILDEIGPMVIEDDLEEERERFNTGGDNPFGENDMPDNVEGDDNETALQVLSTPQPKLEDGVLSSLKFAVGGVIGEKTTKEYARSVHLVKPFVPRY
jgi:hypothetical protein